MSLKNYGLLKNGSHSSMPFQVFSEKEQVVLNVQSKINHYNSCCTKTENWTLIWLPSDSFVTFQSI